MATPIRPPSPSGSTPGILPISVFWPDGVTRRRRAVSRSVTRASPLGRKAMAQGMSRPVTSSRGSPGAVLFAAARGVGVRALPSADGDADGDEEQAARISAATARKNGCCRMGSPPVPGCQQDEVDIMRRHGVKMVTQRDTDEGDDRVSDGRIGSIPQSFVAGRTLSLNRSVTYGTYIERHGDPAVQQRR